MNFLTGYKDGNDKYERTFKSASGFTGVTWHSLTGKWAAFLNGKYVGVYATPEAAAEARYEAKKLLQQGAPPGSVANAADGEEVSLSKRLKLSKEEAAAGTELASATASEPPATSTTLTSAAARKKRASSSTPKPAKGAEHGAQPAQQFTPPSPRTLKANVDRAKTALKTLAEIGGADAADISVAVPGGRADVQGLVSRSDLNGKEGALVRFDSDLQRWVVLMPDDELINVKPANLELVQERNRPKAKGKATLKASPANGDAAGAAAAADTQAAAAGDAAMADPQVAAAGAAVTADTQAAAAGDAAMEDAQVAAAGAAVTAGTQAAAAGDAAMEDAQVAAAGAAVTAGTQVAAPEAPPVNADTAGAAKADTQVTAPEKKPAFIRIHGLASRTDLNGGDGELVKFDPDEGRWVVKMPSGELINVKPANLKFIKEGSKFTGNGTKGVTLAD